jgi:phage I-like protein
MEKRTALIAINANDPTCQIDADTVVCSLDPSGINADSREQLIQLIPAGPDGIISGVDGRSWVMDAEAIIANARASKTDFPIDYNHASLDARKTGARAPAAGWVDRTTLEARPDGIYGLVRWNTPAIKHLTEREFRYTSPVFTFDPRTRKTLAYRGSGLTHYPNLGELKPVVNARDPKENNMKKLIEHLRHFLNLPTASNEQDIVNELHKVIARIGSVAVNANLDDKATLIDAVEAIEAHVARLNEQVAANSNTPDPNAFVPRAEFDNVSAQLKALTDAAENARVEQAVNSALEAGKITPASLDWARDYCRKDPEGFEQFVANTAQILPLGESSSGGDRGGMALSEEEQAVCSQLGLDPEEYKKTKQAQSA